MKVRQALTRGREMLSARGDSQNLSLECEVLLKYYLKVDRAYLFREPDEELSGDVEKAFFEGIARLLRAEPLAYIISSREFFGLDFYVDSRVLIPRPETELIVEEALLFVNERPSSIIADIGTGSGAIAISLAKNLPRTDSAIKIYASDISAPALEVARINSLKHGVADIINLVQGDLAEALPQAVDLLIANLPYVMQGDLAVIPSARFEPLLALDGGKGGLDTLSRFCEGVAVKIKPSGCILLEIGMGQAEAVTALLRKSFPGASITVLPDLAGIDRVVKVVV